MPEQVGAPANQVNVYEAKTHLSKLLERVEAGEEIVIAHNGRPVARLVPTQRDRSPRVLGSLRGKIWYSDDFDESDESDEEITDLFYNGKIFPDEQDEACGCCSTARS